MVSHWLTSCGEINDVPVRSAPRLSPNFTLQTLWALFCDELGFLEQPGVCKSVFFRPNCPITDVFRQILGVLEYL